MRVNKSYYLDNGERHYIYKLENHKCYYRLNGNWVLTQDNTLYIQHRCDEISEAEAFLEMV